MITRVKGMQDFLDMRLFNYIVEQATAHMRSYHFHHIATPIIEHLELFKRSLGEYTDVVSKEMFLLKTHEGHEQMCLRPEGTASTLRAFIENGVQQTPWKVFSYGPMFRYERPQKGRYRQFHQFNIEVIGSQAVSQDVQFITMLDRLFGEVLGLDTYALVINYLGCFEDRKLYMHLLKGFLQEPQCQMVCLTCKERKDKNTMRIFDCKNDHCQTIYKDAPKLTDHLCEQCTTEWHTLQNQLHLLSVSYIHKPGLVRGLDYYNKTVFEFVSDNLGAQNTFCGGGRYDQLVGQLGGKEDQPSIGAALGIERLMMLLEQQGNQNNIVPLPALCVVAPMSAAQHALALLVADTLRAQKLCVDVLLDQDSIKSMMRKANKMGASHVLVIGDDEQKTKTVSVKNMVNGTSASVAQIELVEYLKK